MLLLLLFDIYVCYIEITLYICMLYMYVYATFNVFNNDNVDVPTIGVVVD